MMIGSLFLHGCLSPWASQKEPSNNIVWQEDSPSSEPDSISEEAPALAPIPMPMPAIAIEADILLPGNGFGGPTLEPAVAGVPSQMGYTAKAIARWTQVPYQTLDSDLKVGVIADHIAGIDRVEFSLNGGEWLSITEPELNPETQIVEYAATFSPALVLDGLVELRAIAYPRVGQARVLDSLFLYANSSSSLPAEVRYISVNGDDSLDGLTPQTAKKSAMKAAHSMTSREGGFIYFLPGTHIIESAPWPLSQMANEQRWLTLQAAPGVDKSEVTLVPGSPVTYWGYIRRIRYSYVTLDHSNAVVIYSWKNDARVWYDNVQVNGLENRRGKGFMGTLFPGGRYYTESNFWGIDHGPQGQLIRNCKITHYLQSATGGSLLVANYHAEDQDATGAGGGGNVAYWYGHFENIIVYNLTSRNAPRSQGIFQGRGPEIQSLKDFAILNSNLDHGATIPRVLLLMSTTHHLVIRNSRFVGRTSIEGVTTNGLISQTSFTQTPSNPGVIME